MDNYIELEDGSFQLEGLNVPNAPGNKAYIKMQAQLAAKPVEATLTPYAAPDQATIDAATARSEALDYLASTDWYTIREADGGTAEPQAIKDARAQARIDASL